MIKVAEKVIQGIIDHARQEIPIEACGYLAGKNNIITKYYRLKNTDNSPEHFSFDPGEQFEVFRKVRDEGMEIMANYHSHPETPARPSNEDIKLAYDPSIIYFIVSLANGHPDVKAFRIIDSTVDSMDIKIIN